MQITFFGTGLMGTGFVSRLLANGHDVNVWNRSPVKARALVAQGAVAFDDSPQCDPPPRAPRAAAARMPVCRHFTPPQHRVCPRSNTTSTSPPPTAR
jgi:ketopantoate reductase